MSDIGLAFPVWADVAFFGMMFWFVFAPAALALCAIGWFGRRLPKAARYAAWSAGVLCATPLVLLLFVAIDGSRGDAQRAAEDRALHRTLTKPETMGTFVLPAGAVLTYTDARRRDIRSVALPGPSRIAGILLEGELEPAGYEWSGTLAQDQVIGDWPCKAGWLEFLDAGVVTHCTLSAAHRIAGYDLPAGAISQRDPKTGAWYFVLPMEGPALRIAALGADLPPGSTLSLAADGAPRSFFLASPMAVDGVALQQNARLDGNALIGELAEPTQIGGDTAPAGALILLDLATGKAEKTDRTLADHL